MTHFRFGPIAIADGNLLLTVESNNTHVLSIYPCSRSMKLKRPFIFYCEPSQSLESLLSVNNGFFRINSSSSVPVGDVQLIFQLRCRYAYRLLLTALLTYCLLTDCYPPTSTFFPTVYPHRGNVVHGVSNIWELLLTCKIVPLPDSLY